MNPEGCLGANHTDACSPYKWWLFRIKKNIELLGEKNNSRARFLQNKK